MKYLLIALLAIISSPAHADMWDDEQRQRDVTYMDQQVEQARQDRINIDEHMYEMQQSELRMQEQMREQQYESQQRIYNGTEQFRPY